MIIYIILFFVLVEFTLIKYYIGIRKLIFKYFFNKERGIEWTINYYIPS